MFTHSVTNSVFTQNSMFTHLSQTVCSPKTVCSSIHSQTVNSDNEHIFCDKQNEKQLHLLQTVSKPIPLKEPTYVTNSS